MKKALIALTALLASYSTTPVSAAEEGYWQEPKRYLIEDDGGGIVTEFRVALSYFKKNNMAIAVSGYCASACTLILSSDYNLSVCVNKDARFGFHKPFFMDILGTPAYKLTTAYKSEQMWREEFFNKYPMWLQQVIEDRGGVPAVIQGDGPNDLLWLSYDDLKPFMRTCIPKLPVGNVQ